MVQATAAATAAWLIATRFVDHHEPFFAPIAAVVAGCRLKSAERPTAHAMCRAFEVEAPGVLLALQNLVAV